MKKIFTCLFFVIFIYMIAFRSVLAYSKVDFVENSIDVMAIREENCHTMFGDPQKEGDFAHYLQQIFNVFKFLAPTLVLALTIFEFVKATVSDDKDALMKSVKRTGKRLIFALLLFFLPNLINFLFELLGWYGTCGIG